MTRLPGIVVLVLGIVLLIFGFNAGDSVASEVSKTFTGNPTDRAMWFLIGGAIATVAGLVLTLRGAKK